MNEFYLTLLIFCFYFLIWIRKNFNKKKKRNPWDAIFCWFDIFRLYHFFCCFFLLFWVILLHYIRLTFLLMSINFNGVCSQKCKKLIIFTRVGDTNFHWLISALFTDIIHFFIFPNSFNAKLDHRITLCF